MSSIRILDKYNAYQKWLSERPDWREADLLELTKNLENGTLYYDDQFNIKEQHRNDDAE